MATKTATKKISPKATSSRAAAASQGKKTSAKPAAVSKQAKTKAKRTTTSVTKAVKKPVATKGTKKPIAAAKKSIAKVTKKPIAKASNKSPIKSVTKLFVAPTTKDTAAKIRVSYFGLTSAKSTHGNAQAVIIPCPFESSVTYGTGTKDGPRAIYEASRQVELFDEELWTEPHKIGVHTHDEVIVAPVKSESVEPFPELYDVVKPLVEFNKFPIVIGGERTISLGAIRACADRYPNLSVLQLGAHSDCRRTYEGDPYTHASVSYNIYKRALKEPRITQVGVRNISAEEVAWMEKDKPNINIYWARHQDRWNAQDIVSTLSDNVYLSIDVSAFDSSLMPSTGTPEPGGMSWYQMTELIKILCIKKNVVAADIVELAPIDGLHAPNFMCAKLLYKIIGYKFALELGVTKKYL